MGLMTKYARARVAETIKAGSSQSEIARVSGFSRKKICAWMLHPNDKDIQLKTADRIVAACDEIDRTNEGKPK